MAAAPEWPPETQTAGFPDPPRRKPPTGAIPATFVLDRTGRIALRQVGAAAWDDDAMTTFVRGLAAASSDRTYQAAVDS